MSERPDEIPTKVGIAFETRYQTTKDLVLAAREYQFDYGKWMLASLLAIHGGSLLAISQAGEIREKLYAASGPCLIYGLVLALTSGGVAWVNFTIGSHVYWSWLTDLRKGDEPNLRSGLQRALNATMYLAAVLVSLSIMLFVVAAVKATEALKIEQKTYWYNTPTTADDPK